MFYIMIFIAIPTIPSLLKVQVKLAFNVEGVVTQWQGNIFWLFAFEPWALGIWFYTP